MAEAQTYTQIKADLKTAMKARDAETKDTLRMLLSSFKNKTIELGRDLTEEDILGVLSTEAKRRREAAQAYREGDRAELADKEESELAILEKYLPKQLTDDEVGELVDAVIAEVGAESRRDMGKVMGKVMPQVKGRFDGSRVKDIVLAKLG